MDPHYGFGATAVVKQAVLEQTLRVLHASGVIPATLRSTAPFAYQDTTDSARYSVEYDLFVDLPRLVLAAANHPDIAVSVMCTGNLRVTPTSPAGPTGTVRVGVEIRLTAQPSASFFTRPDGSTGMRIGLIDIRGATDPVHVRLAEGDRSQAFVDNFFRRMLPVVVLVLGGELGRQELTMMPELLTGALGQISAAGLTLGLVRFRVLDGALALGVDVSASTPGFDARLSGDVAAITDYTTLGNLAAAVHPVLLPIALRAAEAAAMAAARAPIDAFTRQHADWVTAHQQWQTVALPAWEAARQAWETGGRVGDEPQRPAEPREPSRPVELHRITLSVGADHIAITGNATGGGINADFSAKARIAVVRGNLQVDLYDLAIHEPWWVILVKALAIAIPFLNAVAAPLVFALSDSIRGNITRSGERSLEGQLNLPGSQQFTLPGTTGPMCRLGVRRVQIGTTGTIVDAQFTIPRTTATVVVGQVHDDDWAAFRGARFRVSLTGALYHPSDPSVRIRWEARRRDSSIVAQRDVPVLGTADALEFAFPVTLPELHPSQGYTVSCRIYRALGTATEELFALSRPLQYSDRLDYRRRFVTRAPAPPVPWTVVDRRATPPTRVIDGWRVIERPAKIHLTDPRSRCRFAAAAAKFTSLTYADALPFPVAEALERREQLCDYCFFGGPDKTTLRI